MGRYHQLRVTGKAKEPKEPAFGREERLREAVRISFAECPFESETVGCFIGKINKPQNNSRVNITYLHFREKLNRKVKFLSTEVEL